MAKAIAVSQSHIVTFNLREYVQVNVDMFYMLPNSLQKLPLQN